MGADAGANGLKTGASLPYQIYFDNLNLDLCTEPPPSNGNLFHIMSLAAGVAGPGSSPGIGASEIPAYHPPAPHHHDFVARAGRFTGVARMTKNPGSELPVLDPATVAPRTGSPYPTEALRAPLAGRAKRALGDALGLRNFGVNLVQLAPGAHSSERHWHERQDEFIYVLEGEITLVTESGARVIGPGSCAGFPAGNPDGHHLINRGNAMAAYLEVGDRLPG
jgi:uncharacterized cupin superfamily protein